MYTKDEVLLQVNNIFRDVLENPKIVLNENSTGDEIEEWDSLAHIQLVVAIEKHFEIRFTSLEIINFRTIGEMCEGVLEKISK